VPTGDGHGNESLHSRQLPKCKSSAINPVKNVTSFTPRSSLTANSVKESQPTIVVLENFHPHNHP